VQFGRVSYTQLEALYAEEMGQKVIYIFLPESFPTDPCEPEPDEKNQLQLAYRQRVTDSGALRHSATSMLELENRVLRIRDELAILRAQMEKRRRRIWLGVGVGLVLLLVIGALVIGLRQNSKRLQKTSDDNSRSLSDLDVRVREIQSLSAPARADRLEHALA
jgi:type II secretory pathway component PulM